MRELELGGIHDDDEHVVLTDSDGSRYTLRIDEALRAAVRRDRPALGAIRATEATPLRPKDIQAMLRQGRSAEEIAQIAKVSVEHVRRYEGPVIAEREYIAQRCRSFPVGRGDGPTLGEHVAERLAARRAGDDVRWDAWRRQDGSWDLELVFSAGGRERSAHWVADLERRSVVAEDDEARWLVDEDMDAVDPASGRARLTSIKRSVYDLEADGAFDEDAQRPRPRPVSPLPWRDASSGADARRGEHPSRISPEDLDALNARRGLRPLPASADRDAEEPVWETLDAPAADADARAEHESELAHELQEDAPASVDPEDAASADPAADADDALLESVGTDEFDRPEPAEDGTGADEDRDPADEDAAPAVEPQEGDTVELTPLPGMVEEAAPARRAPKKKSGARRSSIPSWDEIVFGSKHD